MSRHVTTEQIAQYRAKSMAPGELLALDRHIAQCEECRNQLADTASVSKLFAGLAETTNTPEHLSYDQMADHVDRKSTEPDREIVESHAELCSRCAAELADLAEFALTMNASNVEPEPLVTQSRGLAAISVSKEDLGAKVLAKQRHENKDR